MIALLALHLLAFALLAVTAWIAIVTAAHLATNVEWDVLLNERLPMKERKLNIAYIPVT